MTHVKNHETRARHANRTWVKRFDKHFFVSDAYSNGLSVMKLNLSAGREHLTAKTMQSYDIIYQRYLNDYDWFMKADDDTYVVVENLRLLLSTHSPEEPVFLGHHFPFPVKQGYLSGGAGYVLSREALKRFGGRQRGLCAADGGAEDVEMGRCMEKLGVKPGNSTDELGRSRFHPLPPEYHLLPEKGISFVSTSRGLM